MRQHARLVTSVVALLSATVLLSAGGQLSDSTARIQLQVADLLFTHADYRHALGIYQRVTASDDADLRTRARFGAARSALRVAEFGIAAIHAAALRAAAPTDPDILSLSGDALWASGLFDEAEDAYRRAIDHEPACARARQGLAKALASRNRLDEALEEANAALRGAPADPEVHHTVAFIQERLRHYDLAAAAYEEYLSLLSPEDRAGKEAFTRSQITFLRSFGDRRPFAIEFPKGTVRQTVRFRLVNQKVIVAVKVNGGEPADFAVDTGAEQTVISAKRADRLDIRPMGQTLCAGVGLVGLRPVQVGRIDSLEIGSLKIRNVRCLIKSPALKGMPMGETESFSPLALGLSVSVDYKSRTLTLGPLDPEVGATWELPLRMHRLATVRGTANQRSASFIVDTGGEVVSLSMTTARDVFKPLDRRRIALRVYGSSGLDPDAYLLPGISLSFDPIRLPTQPMVVLNLRAPSALLGYEIGGIIGHKFLSKYRVEFDMERSVLRLREL